MRLPNHPALSNKTKTAFQRDSSRVLLRNLSFVLLWLLVIFAAAEPGGASKKPPVKPVNLNTATSAELQQVPGIGPSTADKILQMRKSYGAFKSVNDLAAIRGIGPKRLEKMRKYLVVGRAGAPAQAGSAEKSSGNAKTKSPPPAKTSTGPENTPPSNETEEPLQR